MVTCLCRPCVGRETLYQRASAGFRVKAPGLSGISHFTPAKCSWALLARSRRSGRAKCGRRGGGCGRRGAGRADSSPEAFGRNGPEPFARPVGGFEPSAPATTHPSLFSPLIPSTRARCWRKVRPAAKSRSSSRQPGARLVKTGAHFRKNRAPFRQRRTRLAKRRPTFSSRARLLRAQTPSARCRAALLL